jgi:hypothetical protein
VLGMTIYRMIAGREVPKRPAPRVADTPPAR